MFLDKNQIESHRYYGQVRMDVERTLKRFPPSKQFSKRNSKLFLFLLKIILIRIELNYKRNLLL
jgi:hypothetical protein